MTRLRFLFGTAVFLASFLLFLVEPIAAKQLLPILGGSAAVWITCLVFFQTALLCAYLYAHWLSRTTASSQLNSRPDGARRYIWILHFLLLMLAAASAGLWALNHAQSETGATHPVSTIFTALSISIGLPFLMLGATSPLLQVWLARIESGPVPYRLFALSNLASLLALGLYPSVIEPNLTLRTQRVLWSCGFAAFALLAAWLTWKSRSASPPTPQEPEGRVPPPQLAQVLKAAEPQLAPPQVAQVLWLLLPMGAAMQLSAVTAYLTQNVAAIPLLWILPLAVYLITIILAFQFPAVFESKWSRGIVIRLMVVMLASLGYLLSHVDTTIPMRWSILFFLVELFVSCLFCHSEAYALRPVRPSQATLFYLLFAAGGALGSFFVGIAAPLIFTYNYDIAIAFFVTALLAFAATWNSGWAQRLLWSTASILLIVLLVMIHTALQRNTLVSIRNFYGTLRVRQNLSYQGAAVRTLSNGSIEHGNQIFASDKMRHTPTTYYAEDSGVGLALRFCCPDAKYGPEVPRPRNIGVIGLGAGTLAAYGRLGDHIRFYEINPAVEPIARNLFTYIRESGAQVDIIDGDARTSLTSEPPQHFDVLAIDAFSGDAIPLHLLTTQALALYRRHLAPDGILAFHISNQHVDLEPAIALLAANAGMTARSLTTPLNPKLGEYTASWVLVTDSPTFFSNPKIVDAAPSQPEQRPNLRLWTDDYSALLPLIQW
jgi:hypothetical protein